jgi:hypothetical protein
VSLPHEWMRDVEAAVVAVFVADPVLSTIAKTIEAATTDAIRDKVLMQVPYVGILCDGVGPNMETGTDAITMLARIKVHIAAINSDIVAAQRQVLDIIARLVYAVALQRGGDMFTAETDVGEIQDVKLDGSGEIIGEQVSEDELSFLVEGAFTFSVQYQLYI